MAIRAREIRVQCTGRIDIAVLHVLEALAEEQHRQNKMIGESISAMQSMELMVDQFLKLSGVFKDKISKLERDNTDPAPDLGPVS